MTRRLVARSFLKKRCKGSEWLSMAPIKARLCAGTDLEDFRSSAFVAEFVSFRLESKLRTCGSTHTEAPNSPLLSSASIEHTRLIGKNILISSRLRSIIKPLLPSGTVNAFNATPFIHDMSPY